MSKQINILVPEAVKRKIDQLINERNAEILKAGHPSVAKGDWVLAALWKYLTGDLGVKESTDWAKRKVAIDSLVEDVRKTLEEANNV